MSAAESAVRRRKSDGYPYGSPKVRREKRRRSFADKGIGYFPRVDAGDPKATAAEAERSARARKAAAAEHNKLAHFEGERPSLDHAAHQGCEIIRLADIDPKLRGRAVRMGGGWRPKTLYSKGRITKRQYAAACELVALYEAGFVAPIKGAGLHRVDASARAGSPVDRMLGAAERYRVAMGRLAGAQRALVCAVVVEGRGVTDALALPEVADQCWMPSARGDRITAAGVLFAAALDALADFFRL